VPSTRVYRMDFIDVQRATYTDLATSYEEFGDLFTRKLWHQLTDKVQAFVLDDGNFRARNMLDLAEKFLSKFENKIEQLRLAVIVVAISRQLYPSTPPTDTQLEAASAFLQNYVEKRARVGTEGIIVLLMHQAQLLMLKTTDTEAAKVASKKLLDEGKALLDSVDAAEPVVYARYYEAAAEYYKRHGPAKSFYDNSIMYLSYTPLDELPADKKYALAHDMALAALVGDGVYNFGEVVEHPIMTALDDTPQAWLRQLLVAFHLGQIDVFNSIAAENRDAWEAQPALGMYEEQVKQKVTLLCLMNLAAELPATERTIPFAAITARTQLPTTEVEWLLMRAMSLGLVKGTIDEVDQVVEISYVKPRVMDKGQIRLLKSKLDAWAGKVLETRTLLENNTAELIG